MTMEFHVMISLHCTRLRTMSIWYIGKCLFSHDSTLEEGIFEQKWDWYRVFLIRNQINVLLVNVCDTRGTKESKRAWRPGYFDVIGSSLHHSKYREDSYIVHCSKPTLSLTFLLFFCFHILLFPLLTKC